jgi:hypothetical protein
MKTIKNYYYSLTNFLESPLGKQVKFYFFFYILVWLIHLILISLVSYFHLLLNHSISTIGDWIVDRGWHLIIISKLLVIFLVFQFVKLKTNYLLLLRTYFKNAIQWPRHEMYVCLIFLITGLLSLGSVQWNASLIFQIDRIILSIIGTFTFFAVDYLLIIILGLVFPVKEEKEINKRLFLFSFLFYFFTYMTFQYEQIISLKLFAYFYLLLYTGIWRRPNWTLPLIVLLVFIIPAFTLLGLDPVWGHSFSLFKTISKISTSSIFILIFFAIGFLHYRLKKNTEYILRE